MNLNQRKENLLYCILLGLFLLYLFYTMQSVTLMADDFRYSMRSSFNNILPQERITSIWQILQTTIYDYLYMGARYATVMITCFVLMFGASLYKFVGPIIIVLQVILFHRVFLSDKSEKNKLLLSGIVIALFSMISPIVMDEGLYWITGAITYSWPITFLLLQLDLFLNDIHHSTLAKRVLYVFLAIYLGSTTENYSIIISCITVLICLYRLYIENNKNFINKDRILSLAILLIANGIQICSPGTRIRVSTFEKITLLEKIFKGVFSFAQYQFYLSRLIPALLIIGLLFLVYKVSKKWGIINIILFTPLLTGIILNSLPNIEFLYQYEWLCYLMMPLDFFTWQGINFNTTIIFIYYCVVLLFLIVDVLICTIKKDFKLLVLFLYSSCSLIALIPLGGASTRTAYLCIVFMIFTVAYLFLNYIERKILFLPILFVSIYFYQFNLSYLSDNVNTAIKRNEIISKIENVEGDILLLPKYRFTVHGNFIEEYTWEHQMFKVYYEISDKTVLFE